MNVISLLLMFILAISIFMPGGVLDPNQVQAQTYRVSSCSDCHSYPPKDATGSRGTPTGAVVGSHWKHTTTYSVACTVCHGASVATYTFTHRDGNVDMASAGSISGGSYSLGTHTSTNDLTGAGLGTCSNVYCHSNGQNVYVAVPKWGTASTGACGTCHGLDATAANQMRTGSHTAHVVTSAQDCVRCHSATMSSGTVISNYAAHVNRQVNVAFDSVNPTGAATPSIQTPGSATRVQCSSLYCHGAGTPTWSTSNGSLNCGSCHSANNTLMGKHNQHFESAVTATNRNAFRSTASTTMYLFNCGVCHYNTNHAGGEAQAGLRAAEVVFDPTIAGSGTYNPGTVVAGADKGFKWTAGAASSACQNIYCHSQGTSFTAYSVPVYSNMSWTGTYTLGCNGCHGDTGSTSGKPSYANGSPKENSHSVHLPWNTMESCQACHYATTTTGTSITDKTHHADRNYDVVSYNGGGAWTTLMKFSYTYQADGGTCGTSQCHAGLTPMWGSIGYGTGAAGDWNCISCHSYSFPKRQGSLGTIRQVVGTGGDFDNTTRLASRHLYSATTILKWDCILCHAEGTAAGNVDWGKHAQTGGLVHLRNVDTINQFWTINNVNGTNWSTTDYTNLDDFCLHCHDADGANGIAVNAGNNGVDTGAAVARRLTPFNSTDYPGGVVGGSTVQTTTRNRIIDIKTKFYAGNPVIAGVGTGASYNGNPSQHAVIGRRYSSINSGWTAAAWSATLLKKTNVAVNVSRETSLLSCADCHVLDAANGAHGGVQKYNLWGSTVKLICTRCHAAATYDSGGAGSRFSHNYARSTQTAYGLNSGTTGDGNCMLCHASWNGSSAANIQNTYGGIHGSWSQWATIPGTPGNAIGAYRFFPGTWRKGTMFTSDAGFADSTSTGQCYFWSGNTAQGFTSCTSHSGSSTGSYSGTYARPTKY